MGFGAGERSVSEPMKPASLNAYRPHHWWSRKCHGVLIGTHFEPPPQKFNFSGGSVEGRGYVAQDYANRLLNVYEKAIQGVTTLTWRCSRCGNVWTTTKPGKAVVDA